MMCTYVLDVRIPGDHTMTVHQGVAHTTDSFDPHETEVANVHRLDAERTTYFKAWGQYQDAVRLWDQQWAKADSAQLQDWESRPKLEDYLGPN